LSASFEFHKTAKLKIKREKTLILIQTDKAIYKPSDKIQFRVLVLDSETKPLKTEDDITVFIEDADQNRVRQFDQVLLKTGVFQGELQLSDSPVLGNWNLHVKVGDCSEEKSFEIKKCVLPRFSVSIQTPLHVVKTDGVIQLTIKAYYTYGKSVEGTAKIKASRYTNSLEKVLKMNGEGQVEFSFEEINDFLKFDQYDTQKNLKFTVNFEDALTGETATDSVTVTVHKFKYYVSVTTDEYHKPGLPWEVIVRVKNCDGTPACNEVDPVTIEIGKIKYSSHLDEFGLAKMTIADENLHGSIKVHFMGVSSATSYLSKKFKSESAKLVARIKTEKPGINEEVRVDVYSTEEVETLHYIVAKNGQVLRAESLKIPRQKTFSFNFVSTFGMLPKCGILVYYIRSNGEIVCDSKEILFKKQLSNDIKLKFSEERCKPGDKVDLMIESTANSFVGLLGVDQSVILLKKGNDLEENDVLKDENWKHDSRYFKCRCVNKAHMYEYEYLFEEAGMLVLTDKVNNHEDEQLEKFDAEITIHLVLRMRGGGAVNPRPRPLTASANEKGGNTSRVESIRKNFPETWIFDCFPEIGSSGKLTVTKTIPDSITSWILTGFSIHPDYGFGLIQEPVKLEVFQQFFISLNLPYSIKRGETIEISATIFNYCQHAMKSQITLINLKGEFDFVELMPARKGSDLKRMKLLNLQNNGGTNVSFLIKPKKVGNILIKMMAKSGSFADSIEKQLLVVPEGKTHYVNKAILLDVRGGRTVENDVEVEIPQNFVPDSSKIEISVVGDVLGGTIKNLHKLIRMPYGCGEQNMLNFVPTIVVLDYLRSMKKTIPGLEAKAIGYMELGYQRELSFKHSDGSYSAFGTHDRSGSTWLTAFVVKSFNQAKKYIKIEDSVTNGALKWLESKQSENGSFPEVGRIIHGFMQGGTAGGLALTAYVLIAFLEIKDSTDQHKNTVDKATDFISKNLENVEDPFVLAVVAYALQLADHPLKQKILEKFDRKAKTQNDMKWWEKSPGSSVDVEMSAYGLLAFIEAGKTDSMQIFKWLISQRNDNGGFKSTQDTVVGLHALSKFAAKIGGSVKNLAVKFETNEKQVEMFDVTKQNSLVLQKSEISPETKKVLIKATGQGSCLAQVSYKYNVSSVEMKEQFKIDVNIAKMEGLKKWEILLSTSFIPDAITKVSNMALMEVVFPSGYILDYDTLQQLEETKKVKVKFYDIFLLV
jgi:CD109 antigen